VVDLWFCSHIVPRWTQNILEFLELSARMRSKLVCPWPEPCVPGFWHVVTATHQDVSHSYLTGGEHNVKCFKILELCFDVLVMAQ
jgi:hypothetical protein